MSSFVTQSIDCFAFRGFKPKATDPLFALLQRAPAGKKLAFLSLSGNAIATATVVVGRKGPVVSEVETSEMEPGMSPYSSDLFRGLPKKTNCGMVVVQYGDFERIDIGQNLRRQTPQVELITISRDARSVVGPDCNPESRYAALTHTTNAYGYIVSIEKVHIDALVGQLDQLKLRPIRIQSSVLSLLSVGMAHPDFVSGKASLLVCDHGHLTYIRAGSNGAWTGPRSRQNVFHAGSTGVSEFLESIAGDETKLIVIDTKLGGSFKSDSVLSADMNAFTGIEGINFAVQAAFADNRDAGNGQALPTVLRGLAHELGHIPIESSLVLPGWMRLVAAAFWIVLFGGAAGIGFFRMQERAAGLEVERVEAQRAPLKSEIANRKIAVAELERRAELAISIDEWVSSNAALQPMFLNLLQPLMEKGTVRQFSVTRKADSPNGEYSLVIIFTSDQRITNSFIQTLSDGVKSAGWAFGHPNLTPSSGAITLEVPVTQPRAN